MTHRHDTPSTRPLAAVLALTVAYTGVEAVGGLISNSLALVADAGHMLTDDLALGLALFAAWYGRRPPDPNRSYGYQRAEILAALTNAVALVVVCGFLFWEAWRRLAHPPEVRTGPMAAIAAGGLVVNIVGAWILRGKRHGLNERGAFLHLLGDLLGSAGALLAAGLVAGFGWRWADPAATVAIGIVIVVGSIRLLLESVHVLMEGVPSGLDTEQIRRSLACVPGVGGVHDLHVWSLSGRAPMLTAHLVLDREVPAPAVLRDALERLRGSFGISHATLQIEPHDFNIVEAIDRDRPQAPEVDTPRR